MWRHCGSLRLAKTDSCHKGVLVVGRWFWVGFRLHSTGHWQGRLGTTGAFTASQLVRTVFQSIMGSHEGAFAAEPAAGDHPRGGYSSFCCGPSKRRLPMSVYLSKARHILYVGVPVIPFNGQTTSNHTELSPPLRPPLDFSAHMPVDMPSGSSRRVASGHQVLPTKY
jgi:hypothetical protein